MFGLGVAKAMAITVKHLVRRPFTIPYPEKRLPLARRYRGMEFAWYEDRCTLCISCAKACPLGIIDIVSEVDRVNNRYRARKFTIDIPRCMFCGLCVEACPFDAIRMGGKYERAGYSYNDLILEVDDLRTQEKTPSAYFRPQVEKELPPESHPDTWEGER